ncbi:MAG: Ig-like domain-containing protein [Gemmatimonadales bacterium]
MRGDERSRTLLLVLRLLLAMAATQACSDRAVTAPVPAVATPVPVVANIVFGVRPRMVVGVSFTLNAASYDTKGRRVTVPLTWATSDSGVASVSPAGLLTARAPGVATLFVTAGAVTDSVAFEVVDFQGTISWTRVAVTYDDAVYPVMESVPALSDIDVLSFSLGTERLREHGVPTQAVLNATWSPDGSRLAWDGARGISGDWYNLIYTSSDVYVLSEWSAPDGWRAITTDGQSRSPDWSPSGDRLAYVSGPPDSSQIYVSNAAGGDRVRLTAPPSRYGTPRWSPDGTRIAFVDRLAGMGYSRINVMNADGTGLRRLVVQDGEQLAPNWSPDGRLIAFGFTGLFAPSEVFVVDADGSNLRQVTNLVDGKESRDPVWSPDGRSIAFSVSNNDTNAPASGLYVMDANGSRPTQLTFASGASEVHLPRAWRR